MGGDGATVADGSVVADGNLFRKCTIEEAVVTYIYSFANIHTTAAVYRRTPPFEWNEESKARKTETPQLDECVFKMSDTAVKSVVLKYFFARHDVILL